LSVLVAARADATGAAMRDSLQAAGWHVEWRVDVASTARSLARSVPDLVVLDAGLAGADRLCRQIRVEHCDVPIMLVAADDAEIDLAVVSRWGADDSITRPFPIHVLLARVRALLQRADAIGGRAPVEGVTICPAAVVAVVNGVPLVVRRAEFELLVVLARNTGRTVIRERLLAEAWGASTDLATIMTLDVRVHALRRKVAAVVEITTVRGVGYRLDAREAID
jgi:DNA-binding response OmpR family regulator